MPGQTFRGGCHCGAVRFRASVDLDNIVVCNCSWCSVRGFRWAFLPAADLVVEAGEAALATYRFHEHVIDHRFCRTCGVEPFALSRTNGAETAMVDVRCLDGVDLTLLPPPTFYDGRAR